MDLADKVIQANEQEIIEKSKDDKAPEELYTDDLGFWVELDIRKHKDKFARYVLFRCIRLNPHLHVRHATMLYNKHTFISPTSIDIASLADLPENIPAPIAVWVHKRLMASVPHLDKSKIEVCPGFLWDLEKGELVSVPIDSYITVS